MKLFHRLSLIVLTTLLLAPGTMLAAAESSWVRQSPTDFHRVELRGDLGAAADRAVARLSEPPFTLNWLRADLSGELKRPFTNFSGDVSGRFLEVASLTSPPGQPAPPTLPQLLATVTDYQQPDGHFGAPVEWQDVHQVMSRGTPILWGNARMLVGLVTAYEEFKQPQILAAARRLGDFYVNLADTLCDPVREQNLHAATANYTAFDVCYFPAIESLARLYLRTHDRRYLQVAERMEARFIEWDKLPLPHTHGNLCAQYGRLLLYEITGQADNLHRVERRWEEMCRGGYAWADGGVGEECKPKSPRDEGCAEADWLRINLRLWADTGHPRYLDEADRTIHNEYLANQFPSGGFGHRDMECDPGGLHALLQRSEEATWCCCFHGPLGYVYLKSYLATGDADGLRLNFPLDFTARLKASGGAWRLNCQTVTNRSGQELVCQVNLQPLDAATPPATRLRVRVPDWATALTASDAHGGNLTLTAAGPGVVSTPLLNGATEFRLVFQKSLRVEDRQRKLVPLPSKSNAVLKDVVLRDGPEVLFASVPTGIPTLSVARDAAGNWQLPPDAAGHFEAAVLPGASPPAAGAQTKLTLGPWASLPESNRKVFVFNLVVAPKNQASP